MSDTVTVVLSDVERKDGSNDKGPWTKFSLRDGNGKIVGATFAAALGDAAQSLVGERVQVDLEPARDPKFAPTVKAIRPAPPEQAEQNGAGDKMSKEEWRAKDLAAHKRATIAIASSAFIPELHSASSKEDITSYAARVLALARHFYDETTRTYTRELGKATLESDPDSVPFE